MIKTSDQPEQLVRAIGFWGLVLMCINAVVGSGVFLLPSEGFKLLGPFSLWGPLLFAIPVFILVLCFAEASSHFDQPGGAFLYTKTVFGDFIGFETGWMNWLARLTSLAALSNGFVVALGRIFPEAEQGAWRVLLIAGTIAILTAIHSAGVKHGARTTYLFTYGKLIPLVGFIILALLMFRNNPFPGSFTLPGAGTDWSEASLLLLFAYAGFENMGVPAGEFKNPRRDVPLALLAGILAIAVIYSLAQLAAMSALPNLGASKTPIADAASTLIGPAGALIITVGAILSILGTNSGTVLEGSRTLYAITENRRGLGFIRWIHPRFRTPVIAIIIHAGLATAAALAGSFTKLAALSAVARMTTYLFTCASLPRLRKISPGFRAPGGLLIPILGTAISVLLFATLKSRHLIAAAVALAVGVLLYFITRDRSAEVRTHQSV